MTKAELLKALEPYPDDMHVRLYDLATCKSREVAECDEVEERAAPSGELSKVILLQ